MGDAELAYLAGFFDGEGCVNIHETAKGAFRGQLVISNTVRESMEPFMRWHGHMYIVPATWKTTVPRVQQSYTWQANGPDAAACLRDLLPYLRVKREQAENALEFFRVMAQGKARSTAELHRLVERHHALSFYSRTPPPTPLEVDDPQGSLFVEITAATADKST